jgi:hypothetical protein
VPLACAHRGVCLVRPSVHRRRGADRQLELCCRDHQGRWPLGAAESETADHPACRLGQVRRQGDPAGRLPDDMVESRRQGASLVERRDALMQDSVE